VVKVHRLRHGAAEAIELVVHGDEKSSRVVGRRIGELPVIEGANIAAIVRNIDKTYRIPDSGGVLKSRKGSVLIAHKDIVIESGDHVIVFCLTNKVVKKAEKLFQVGLHFF
jgi:trk system potassium uptake protein TrkA